MTSEFSAVEEAMEQILIGLVILATAAGVLVKGRRDSSRREREALESLRLLVEDKQHQRDESTVG